MISLLVQQALNATPRSEFLPEELRGEAWRDAPIPIGYGATASQPSLVARMTDLLDVQPYHRVLEIGTGSGYQAAILSLLAREVFGMELVPELAERAAETLLRLNRRNVVVRPGNGYAGWPTFAPFDRIMVTAAPPEIPQALVDQLTLGGRMIAPVGREDQNLIVLDKGLDGSLQMYKAGAVLFVPMR